MAAASSAMVLTNLHLRPEQKRLMQKRAKERGTNLAEEMRAAVDAYLNGITPAEFELINQASLETSKLFEEMTKTLEATNANAARIFKMMETLKSKEGV